MHIAVAVLHYTFRIKVLSKALTRQSSWHVFVFQVASRFVGSFQCDQECGHLQDEDLKTQCEQQFCEQLKDDEYEDYYEDDE